MKKAKPKSGEPTLFFLNFHGEFVSFLLDSKTTSTQQTEEEIHSAEIPLSVQGFFVDEDEQWVYLGKVQDVMSAAIPKSRVLYVTIVEQEVDITNTILDEMEIPEPGKAN